MTTIPHQGLDARTRRVRAPGSRTAAPSFQNCRTVEIMGRSLSDLPAQSENSTLELLH